MESSAGKLKGKPSVFWTPRLIRIAPLRRTKTDYPARATSSPPPLRLPSIAYIWLQYSILCSQHRIQTPDLFSQYRCFKPCYVPFYLRKQHLPAELGSSHSPRS